jgi:hypothetical protein
MTRSLYAENVVVDMHRTALASVRTTCDSATVSRSKFQLTGLLAR